MCVLKLSMLVKNSDLFKDNRTFLSPSIHTVVSHKVIVFHEGKLALYSSSKILN